MQRGGEQRDGRAAAEGRGDDGEVEQVPGAVPRIVGQVHVAILHGLHRVFLQEEPDRGGHRVNMARRAGDGLGQHPAREVEHAGREVAGLAHGGGEGGADQRLRLLLDDGDQPVPDHLVAHRRRGGGGSGRCIAGRHHKVATSVDGKREAFRHDTGRLVLADGGRPGESRSGEKRRAVVQRGLKSIPHAGKPDRAGPDGGGFLGGQRALILRRAQDEGAFAIRTILTTCNILILSLSKDAASGTAFHRAQLQRPGQHLDIEAGDGAGVLPRVLGREGVAQRRRTLCPEIAVRQRHLDLVTLADIAAPGMASGGQGCVRRAQPHHGLGLFAHLLEQRRDGAGIEVREPRITAAHHLVGNRRQQHADGRADPGVLRHDDALDAELFGEARRVQRRRAAEGDHRAPGDLGPALHRVHPRRRRHVLVDDLDDALGCGDGIRGLFVVPVCGRDVTPNQPSPVKGEGFISRAVPHVFRPRNGERLFIARARAN
jgi:hypothetical protein